MPSDTDKQTRLPYDGWLAIVKLKGLIDQVGRGKRRSIKELVCEACIEKLERYEAQEAGKEGDEC